MKTTLIENLFIRGSYYIILLMIILWCFLLLRHLQMCEFSFSAFLKRNKVGLVIAFLLAGVVFISIPVGFKTLADETNLLSVSRSMLMDRTCSNITMAEYYYDNLHPIASVIDKRPLVFPFLLNILHTFTGFRYQNAFVLNFIVLFSLLFGLYRITRIWLDEISSTAAMFLAVSYPVVTIFATSGGFDLFNAAVLVLICVLVYNYIYQPSLELFHFLLISLVVFANIRYESALFLILVPLLLIPCLPWRYVKKSLWLLMFIPVLMLPYIWQRLLRGDTYQNPDGVALFSVTSLKTNAWIFLKSMISFDGHLPYAEILSLAALFIYGSLIIAILTGKIHVGKKNRHATSVIVLLVLIGTLLYFSHFFGDCTHPSSARFFIFLAIALSFAPVLMRICFPRFISNKLLLFGAIAAFIYYHPTAIESRFTNTLTLNRKMRYVMDYLKEDGNKRMLIVASHPNLYTALGYGSVSFFYVNQNPEWLKKRMQQNLFSTVMIVQEIRYNDSAPTDDTTLTPLFHSRMLRILQNTAETFLQISEVQKP